MAASHRNSLNLHLHKQHKAKSAPGKFFVKSEPQCRVKFLRKTRSIWQFQLNFRVRAIELSATLPPSENTYGDRHMQSLHLFRRKHLLMSPRRLKTVTHQ
jgi:hypothetical protein